MCRLGGLAGTLARLCFYMAITTYSTDADIELTLSLHGLASAVDDEESGGTALTSVRKERIQRQRERAFNRINGYLNRRWRLAELLGNQWLRDCEALMATYYLEGRRLNVPGASLDKEYHEYIEELKLLAANKMDLPNQRDSFDDGPAVTNYDVRRGRVSPIRVRLSESTGSQPVSGIKREVTPENSEYI